MASTTQDRPVRLIRVQPNPVFQEPKHLPIKPLTLAPIEIERPPDYLESCIHRADFKDIHADLLKDYAKYYDIKIDHERILRAEIMAVLCMKNEWIPILPDHDATHLERGHVHLSRQSTTIEDDGSVPIDAPGAEAEAYIPDRFSTPEDTYPDDTGSSTKEFAKNSNGDITGDFDFDTLPSPRSVGDLVKLTSSLQARHTQVQCALKDATAAAREAAANVLEMMARLETEKTKMKKIMDTVSEIVGEYDVENEQQLNEASDEQVDEGIVQSAKRKGKQREKDPIRSSAHSSFSREHNFLRPSPLCPNCRVARDLTVSQRHSIYLCAEHMPNPYQENGTPNQGSQAPTSATASSSRSTRNGTEFQHPSSSNSDSTIIFGLTSKSASTSNSLSKGKKRSLEESEAGGASLPSSSSRNQRPKRARVEELQRIREIRRRISLKNPLSASIPWRGTPLRRTISISGINDPEEAAERGEVPALKKAAPLRRSFTINDFDDPEEVAERGEVPALKAAPLRRSFTIEDFDDPEEVANIERLESLIFLSSRNCVPSSSNLDPQVDVEAERTPTPRTNAPLRRTFSINDLNDPEEVSIAARQESGLAHWQPGQLENFLGGPSKSTLSRNGPLRRSLLIVEANDPEEVESAEREEDLITRENTTPGLTIASDGEEPPTLRTNQPLRRTVSICDLDDPIEVGRAERLTAAKAGPRMPVAHPGVQKTHELLSRTLKTRTATPPQVIVTPSGTEEDSTTSNASPSMPGKRVRDLGDDDGGDEGQERAQKKARMAE